MRYSQAYSRYRSQLLSSAPENCLSAVLLGLLLGLIVVPSRAQDTGSAATEFHGKGVTISVVVHGPSGEPIASSAVVKLFRGTISSGQAETTSGRAELVAYDVGDFTVVVEAAGYASAQKDVWIDAAGRASVDVYLRSLSADPTGAPGRALLAPKAKKAVEEGLRALTADNLAEAQKHAKEAARLAPSHPDVLYLQGVIFLKQRDWSKAQDVLEKATQVDPSHASALAALGMALCDEGKYESAVAPLEKALQLNPAAHSWDTRWALAKAYYQQARYDQALQMSQVALSSSHGKAPEIELLVAQSLTAVGRYDDAARELREFLRDHADRREAATARRWLDRLAASGKIRND
ncbi:MAG TPA: tetratricopeptide repeat protein [Candidatus Sulfotelmatobacter sp.]|nr:tetratricopeptide repeat protein [Candidatus Sulfotelmatobacter sp.]